MLKYTICFIQYGDELLLLNRLKSPNMGLWNGIGGKLEANETPLQSIIREIAEETGLIVEPDQVQPAGVVRWISSHDDCNEAQSGMYVFYCNLQEEKLHIDTPVAVDEGILMWKSLSWVLHEHNAGIVDNIQHFLPVILQGNLQLEHIFTYNDQDELVAYRTKPLEWLAEGSTMSIVK